MQTNARSPTPFVDGRKPNSHVSSDRGRSGAQLLAATDGGIGPRVNGLRLRPSASRTTRPCRESLLELAFQALGRYVMFCLNVHGDLEPDPDGLEADDLHVVGNVLAIRMVIALAFFKRIFTQSLPMNMNQAHSFIIADVYRTRCVSKSSSRASPSGGTTTLPAMGQMLRSAPAGRGRPPDGSMSPVLAAAGVSGAMSPAHSTGAQARAPAAGRVRGPYGD
jgi:hypothetical protein